MPPTYSDLVKLVQLGETSFALAHKPSVTWPLSKYLHASNVPSIRVGILDSSFNPPTIAHRAMLRSTRPSIFNMENFTDHADDPDQYDARLLLLSVRNVDKTLKPQDADYSQRVEMMTILSNCDPEVSETTAVGLLDAPTFVAKALILRSALLDMLPTGFNAQIRMSWIIGLDTLERLFASRYYTSEAAMVVSLHEFFDPGQGNNEVICAWRGDASTLDCIPQVANEFVSSGRIRFLSLNDTMRTVSSSEIRNRRGAADDSWVDLAPAEVAEYIRQHQLYLPSEEPIP
jgi:nicotinamide-nucleotide adenylyltransferase